MKALCNLITKKIEGFSRWDEIPCDPEFYIVVDIDHDPDMENERLNDTNDGLRPITQTEIDADAAEAKTIEADIEVSLDSTVKAFALVVLDEVNILRVAAGLPTRTVQQLKDAVEAKL